MHYTPGKFLFAPRPHLSVQAERLDYYEGTGWVSHHAIRGPLLTISVSTKGLKIWDQKKRVVCTETTHPEFFHKFPRSEKVSVFSGIEKEGLIIIEDILVQEGNYLAGVTLEDRAAILKELMPSQSQKRGIHMISDHIGRARIFDRDLPIHYDKSPRGLVIRRWNSVLGICDSPTSNSFWMARVLKEPTDESSPVLRLIK